MNPLEQASLKRSFLLLRWLLVIVCCAMIIFSRNYIVEIVWAHALALFLIGSNLVLYLLPQRTFSRTRIYGFIGLADIALVTLALVVSGQTASDFYMVYFLVVIISALSRELSQVIMTTTVVILLYGFILTWTASDLFLDSAILLRLPFFFVVALFYGHLVQLIQNEQLKRGADSALHRTLKTREEVQKVLTEISQDITTLDIDNLLEKLTTKVRDLFQVDLSDVRLVEGEIWHRQAISGSDPSRIPPGPGSSTSGRRSRWVRENRAPLMIPDLAQKGVGSVGALFQSEAIRAYLAVPILAASGEVIGIIRALSKEPREFSQEEIDLLQQLANGAAIAVENARLYQLTKKQEGIQRLLKELGQDMSTLDTKQLLQKITEKVRDVLNVDMSDVRVVEKGKTTVIAFSGKGSERWESRQGDQGRWKWFAENHRPLIIADMTKMPEFGAIGRTTRELGVRGYLGVPFFSRQGELMGILRALSYQSREFLAEEVELLQQLANGAAIALENASLFEAVGQKSKELEEANVRLNQLFKEQTALREMISQINLLDMEELLEKIAKEAGALLGADHIQLRLLNKDGILKTVARYGKGSNSFRNHSRATTSGRSSWMLEHRKPLAIKDITHDPLFGPGELLRDLQVKGYLGVPLISRKQEAVGVLLAFTLAAREFTEGELALAQQFAAGAAIAIENAKLYQKSKRSEEIQALLREISQDVTSLDLERSLQKLTRKVTEAIKVDISDFRLLEKDRSRIVAVSGVDPRKLSTGGGGKARLRRYIENRKPLIVSDISKATLSESGNFGAHLIKIGIKGFMGFPLFSRRGEMIGVLRALSYRPREFTAEEIDLVQTLADGAAVAVENALLYQLTKSQEETQRLLKDLGQDITTLDVESLLKKLTQRVRDVLKVDISDVRIIGKEKTTLVALSGIEPHQLRRRREGKGRWRWFVENRGPLLIPDLNQVPESTAVGQGIRDLGVRGYLGVPLWGRDGNIIGILRGLTYEPRQFSQEDTEFLQQMGNGAAIALENARLFEEVRQKTQELEKSNESLGRLFAEQSALREVLSQINLLDMDELLQRIAQHALQLLRVDHVHIRLLTADGFLKAVGSAGSQSRFTERLLKADSGRSAWVMKNLKPLAILDITQDREFGPGHIMREEGTKSYLGLPLISRGHKPVGVLIAQSRVERPFTAEEITLAQQFAAGAAVAIENARLFEEVQMKTRELEQSYQAKSDFLNMMAHELKTPLNVIIGNTQLLHDGYYGEVGDRAQKGLRTTQKNAENLLNLINEILDLARLEARSVPIHIEEFSLAEFLDELEALFSPLVKEKGLALELRLDCEALTLKSDKAKLKGILQNLIGNAVKYTDKGKVELRITTQKGEQSAEEHVLFSVTDTGIGIKSEDIARIFEPFRMVEGLDRAKYPGSGLGLSLVQQLVQTLKGNICAESDWGRGSTFKVRLPVVYPTSV